MKFCLENLKDINKYYTGSFVKFTGLRGKHSDGREIEAADRIHHIEKISGGTIMGKRWEGSDVVPFTFKIYSTEIHPERCPDIDIILPKKSFFNTPEGCYFLARIPARQYSKGITYENTSLQHMQYGEFNLVDLTGPRLEAYVNKPMFMGFAERELSYAVSSRVAVMAEKIYVDTMPIGKVNYESKQIQVLPIFHEELAAILYNHGQRGEWELTAPVVPKKKYKKGDVKPKQEEVQF